MENKEKFFNRLIPYFSPSDVLDIKLAYCLAKFGHRWQTRKELVDNKPERYFEHLRRVALNLIDICQIYDKNMIIAALLHDIIEDCGDHDMTPELLEHTFGSEVVSMVKILSKVPKEGYIDRLFNAKNWKVLTIKACDRLDNLQSLMVPGTTLEFQKKQIKETKEKYFILFDEMITLCPFSYYTNISKIRDQIRSLITKYSTILELQGETA